MRVKTLDDVRAIRTEVFVGEQNVPVELEFDERDTDGTAIHVLVSDADGPCATARAYLTDVIHIGRVAVLSRVRGTGMGRVVMEEIETEARAEFGDHPFALSAQVQAIGFYEKLGYRLVPGEPYLDAGIPHRDMIKD